MAETTKTTVSVCNQCRRAGEKLYLKGARCHSPKCAIVKRNYAPGQHGQRPSRRASDFGAQLREKQKVKRIYGVAEDQFRRYYEEASKSKAVTTDSMLASLEARLDNMVYRLGFANSRSQARQMVGHGHVAVNGKRVSIPSYQVAIGDVVAVHEASKTSPLFTQTPERLTHYQLPEWLELDAKGLTGKVLALPSYAQAGQGIDFQLIVERYSR